MIDDNKIKMKVCRTCKIEFIMKTKSYCKDCMKKRNDIDRYIKYENFPYKGYIYIVINPAWNGWIKVGRAVDVQKRVASYNTSSPHRDFKSVFSVQVNHPTIIENHFFEKYGTETNEWFNISVEEAINEIMRLKKELLKEEILEL